MRYFFLFTLIMVAACTKENERDWVVADISVVSLLDNSPIVRKIQLKYTKSGNSTKKDLGWTDANGKMHIEEKVPRGAEYSLGVYTFNQSDPKEYIFITNKKKNTVVMYDKPRYYYRRHIRNVNCFNEEDSLWLDNFNYYGFNGCTDGIIENFPGIGASINPVSEKSIHVKVKRNGIVTQFQKDFTLVSEVENILLIEY